MSAAEQIHPALVFDRSAHEYRLGGRLMPSVTKVLGSVGVISHSGVDPETLRRKAAIGTLVHEFTATLDRGEDEIETVADWPEGGYIRAWASFRQQSGFQPLLVEHLFAHQQNGMWYAGTLDRLGKIGNREAVVEIKTSSQPQRWWGCQLAAYSLAMETWPEPSRVLRGRQRIAVQLKPDGEFTVHEYREAMDTHAFLGALAVETWRNM